jgi:hypothetical protein
MSQNHEGFGLSFADHLDQDLQAAVELAKPRTPVEWGVPSGYDALDLNIPLKDLPGEQVDTRVTPAAEVANTALLVRDIAEWNGWARDTAFPDVRTVATPGEPLGQCLVTSRFAKDYFKDARVAEVRVRSVTGETVGPHVILTVPSYEGDEMALDLTPDQALAVGRIPLAARVMLPHFRVNYIPLSDPRNPYEIVRYQSDEELATKQSQPLDHTRLLKEKIAFATGHPDALRLEKYAEGLHPDDLLTANIEPYFWQLLDLCGTGRRLADPAQFEVEAGAIRPHEFGPNPTWLWQTAGLAGFNKAIIYNRGFVQELLFQGDDNIYIFNLSGPNPPQSVLDAVQQMVGSESTRVLTGKQLIKEQVGAKGWSGPIYVQP